MTALTLRLLAAALLTLILTILPMPDLFFGIRPAWVLLFVLYMQFFLNDHFNVVILLVLGLALDVLLSTVLGEHTFALSIVSWIANTKSRRFRLFTIGQQMALIGFFCLVYQLIILTIDAFFGYRLGLFVSVGSTVVSVLLWPWVRLIADESLASKVRYRR